MYGASGLLDLLGFLEREPRLLRARVAALAPEVDRLAEEGDHAAREVLEEAARELYLLGSTLAERLGTRSLAALGSVFQSRWVREAFSRRAREGGYLLSPSAPDPARHAALWARSLGGWGRDQSQRREGQVW